MAASKQKIGWVGVGRMGYPMVERLLEAGCDVSVWNRTARQHVDGATTAVSPADAAKEAEVVRDRNWVTSRQPSDIPAFNREMLGLFAEQRAPAGVR